MLEMSIKTEVALEENKQKENSENSCNTYPQDTIHPRYISSIQTTQKEKNKLVFVILVFVFEENLIVFLVFEAILTILPCISLVHVLR